MADTLRTIDEELLLRTEKTSAELTGALVPVLLAGILCTTAITEFATSVGSVLVEDAIVNGVTTKAPSQNAVYDALALKANIADVIAGYQPLDADLTSWSAVTRAAGFDAFVTSPSGANLATLLTSALPVSKGGTNATSASITAFNNITGYSAAGATGTTSTNLVFSTSPTLVTPNLGAATATSINGLTITSSTGTLTITNGKTLAVSNSLTLTATDGSTLAIGAGGTLASAAYVATGTSGATIPLLNGTNLWGAARNQFAANSEVFALGVRYGTGTGSFWFGATNSATPDGIFSDTSGTEILRLLNGGGATLAGDRIMTRGATETVTGVKTFTGVTVMNRAANEQLQFWRDGGVLAFYDVTGATRRGYIQHDTPSMHIRNEATNGDIQLTTAGTGRVVTSGEFAVASASVGFLLKNSATDYLHTIDKDNTGISFTCNSGSRSFRFLVGGSQEVEIIGGAKFGNPTGGFKGLGTINATAVYDDNTLLTCYIVEAWKHGQIDLAKWDALAPNREHPATYETVETGEMDADGKPVTEQRVVTEAYTEVRQHVPARGFAKVAADRLDIDKFSQFIWDNERLPAFPAPDRWKEMYSGKMATGDLIQRLWETAEVMAIHSIEARKRELALTARIEALEAA